jgi:hypothetical protein
MIVMKFTIELDIGLSYLLRSALPLASDRSRDKTHRRGRSSDRTATAGAALTISGFCRVDRERFAQIGSSSRRAASALSIASTIRRRFLLAMTTSRRDVRAASAGRLD